MTLPSPPRAAGIATGAPRIEPKWTMGNEVWVQVMREIHRGPRGLYDLPTLTNTNGAK